MIIGIVTFIFMMSVSEKNLLTGYNAQIAICNLNGSKNCLNYLSLYRIKKFL